MLKVKFDFLKITTNSTTITLLENLDFRLQPNTVNTIIGKNGTGKTSLLLAITKLLDRVKYNYQGTVDLFGENIFQLSEKEMRIFRSNNIRYVLQDPVGSFDPLKKLQYYFELLNLDKDEIQSEIDYFQLPKYNELRSLYPYELSVGMAQRVNIILALLSKPRFLLLDEPTSALDLPIANLLYRRLREFAKLEDRIILIVTQDFEFAKNVSDTIALFNNKILTPFYTPNIFVRSHNNKDIDDFMNNYNEISG